MAPPRTPPTPRPAPTTDAIWYFARWMLRWWGLALGAGAMVAISGASLGVGLLGAKPVLTNILGARKDLPAFVRDWNGWIAEHPAFALLRVPEAWREALPRGPFTALVVILSALCVLTLVGSLANFAHAYLSLTAVNRTVTLARRLAYRRMLRAPLREVLREGPSNAISRIINDSAQVASGLNVLLSRAVLQVFKGAAGLLAAIAYDWRVTLGTLAVAPLLVLVIRRLGKRIKRYSGRALESQAGLYTSAGEALRGLRVVKVNQAEPRESGRFRGLNERMLHELNRVRTARALASPLTEMLTIFLLCGIVLGAGNAILKQNVDPTDFIMVIGCLAVAGASLKPLTGIVNDVQIAAPAAERLREVLSTAPEPGHERRLPRLRRHSRELRFDGVTLTHPGAIVPALREVSLAIAHGSRVAFVGPNGSGKSTLLGLVPRLYDPDAGRVLIDGVDVRGVRVGGLRRQIAVVTQETVLFRGSVAENIGYGSLGATRARIEQAARLARAHEFIEALPRGYDTELAEQGATLSGGQRQRLAIARAVLRDPTILILDEATSMIDAESEAQIGAAIAEFAAGRTCLIVAHRLSTVVGCDSIVVLDRGSVADQGTHADLLARCEVYRQLARHQFAGVG